jgi:tripartite-type tricarboxylate transporter receptor subunit TctC
MPTVRAINAAFNRALAVPSVQDRLRQMTMNVVTDSTPESAAAFLASETAKWTPVIRNAGIRPS